MPVEHLNIELTSACDLDCPLCPAGASNAGHPRTFMAEAVFERILAQLRTLPAPPRVHLWNFGEPLLHPRAAEWTGRLEAQGSRCTISTNGQSLLRVARELAASGVSDLMVSVDGLTEESYQAYRRRGSLRKLLDGVAEFRRHKQAGTRLTMQFIVLASNEHERSQAFAFGRRHGFDSVLLKTATNLGKADEAAWFDALQPWLPGRTEDRRFRPEPGLRGPQLNGALQATCRPIRESLVISCDGTLLPCSHDSNAEFKLGSILELELRQREEDPRFRAFQARADDLAAMPAMCRVCPERWGHDLAVAWSPEAPQGGRVRRAVGRAARRMGIHPLAAGVARFLGLG